MLYPALENTIRTLEESTGGLSADRRALLDTIAESVDRQQGDLFLNFICTHNSRRSMLGQAWAQVAAYYHGIEGISSVSGGTEVSAFHPNSIAVLRRQGFNIEMKVPGVNPVYTLGYATDAAPLKMFSKLFSDAVPAGKNFLAMMVCHEADQACPLVPGNSGRFQLNYLDPGASDGKPGQDAAYDDRAKQVAEEMLYVFSRVKKRD